MKDKDVKSALGKSKVLEIEDLLGDIDITDDETLESLNKKQQKQLKKVVKFFTEKMEESENSAVEKATADTRKREDATIQKFSADNPGMKNQEVVDLMQPLYDKGKPLSECYAVACKALDLDPKTGVTPVQETAEEKVEREKKEAKTKKDEKVKKITSAKSTVTDDPAGDDEGEGKKEDAPLSIEESLKANSAAYIAKHGDPFATQKE
jgi:hypothetical protein